MICLFNSKETNFNNNGLVVLGDCKSFYTSERLNDIYEVEFEYPMDLRGKWQYITEGNVVKNSDGQLFRVYHKAKNLTGIKANARHIFYDLLDNFLEDVRSTNLSGYGALDYVLSHTQYTHPFTSEGDVGGTNTRYFQKKNPVEAIMGQDGIIATWGGEIIRDNFTIKLMQARGLDRGVLVSYGKNIVGIEETIDLDSVVTRIYPTGKDGLTLSEKYVDSQYINNYPHPKIKEVQFSDIDNETDLRTAAQNYFTTSKCDIPLSNYTIDFIELSKTEEYKNYAILETVYLGDIVTVKQTKLNINLKCKVIRIKKNDLTGRIEEVELGSFKPNLADTLIKLNNLNAAIDAVSNSVDQVKSDYQAAVDNATALITGSKGGNVVIHQDSNGHPYEILIMDTTDINTAQNVWRWNSGGFGYSSTGYNGPYGTAITMDGHIVASFITALTITGEMIKTGIIQSQNGKWQLNLDGETINLGSKLTFDGTNLSIKLSDGNTIEQEFDAVNGSITQKVSNSDFTSYQQQTAQQISSKVSSSDMGSEIQQNADSVKIAVGQIGGNQLLHHTDFSDCVDNSMPWGWYTWGGAGIFGQQGQTGYDTPGTIYIMNTTASGGGFWQNDIDIKPNTKYTFSAVFTKEINVKGGEFVIEYCDSNYNVLSQTYIEPIFDGQRHSYTFTSNSGYSIIKCGLYHWGSNDPNNGVIIQMTYPKLEEGENATAWSPNANELKSVYVTVTDDGLEVDGGALKVKNSNGTVTIDGSKLTLRILTYGNGSIVIPNGSQTISVTIPHNLGYEPIFKGQIGYINLSGNVEYYSDALNLIQSDNGALTYNVRMFVDKTNLTIIAWRNSSLASSGTQTFYYRYFIEEGVNF